MDFLIDYGAFVAKGVTLLIFLMIAIGIIASLKKGEGLEKGKLEVNKLNDKYDHMRQQMSSLLDSKKAVKQAEKEKKKAQKEEARTTERKPVTFLVDFQGDMQAKQVSRLREEISAILTIASDKDEVLVKVESGGGVIHGYGLAASQLDRVRKKGIKLTIAVDKVAASGGYMMACVGDRILAAPFAILGSIGVVAQLPNINRLLKKHDVDIEMHTAGEHKRTLTMIGENTEEGRKKFVEDLQEAHDLFKTFVAEHRPQVDIDKVATGEIWFGNQSIENNLIDEVITSDEYILAQLDERDVYEVKFTSKKTLSEKLGKTAENTSASITDRVIERLSETRFPG